MLLDRLSASRFTLHGPDSKTTTFRAPGSLSFSIKYSLDGDVLRRTLRGRIFGRPFMLRVTG